MVIRDSVAKLGARGRLPEEGAAVAEDLKEWWELLKGIEGPVSAEEVRVLVGVFPVGERSCFGLAWSV